MDESEVIETVKEYYPSGEEQSILLKYVDKQLTRSFYKSGGIEREEYYILIIPMDDETPCDDGRAG